jgi:peptidoglycan/xylan/chitin deacetylase (PgdA/CDA1 family)
MKENEVGPKAKPLAGLSLDLDNQWSYMKTHGEPGWQEFPSYFDIFLPPFLDLMDELDLKITFFIVGQDAALQKNAAVLRQLTERGHEVGNHSFHHEPWLHAYSRERLEADISDTEDHIAKVTGQKPVGFRGPGFSCSRELLEVLVHRGYMYDASTLPTYLGPLARLYYFNKSDLSDSDKLQRRTLFGKFKNGFLPLKPYLWQLPSSDLFLELPVTTIPVLKIPFHLSYLLYISRYSEQLMLFYLSIALCFCRLTRTNLSFLLHPLDFMDERQIPELAFFPGMDINKEKKIEIFKKAMGMISRHFRLVKLSAFAQAVLDGDSLRKIHLENYLS